jgi:hypothetical protein
MSAPKRYTTIEEFEREEIRRDMKVGFSLDDLFAEASIERRPEEQEEPSELDFDY